MTGRQATLASLAIAGGILAVRELLALTNTEEGDTISAEAHSAIIDYPVVAGLLVVPVVHFCTPTRKPGEALPWWQGPTVALIGGAILGLPWPRYDRSRPKGAR